MKVLSSFTASDIDKFYSLVNADLKDLKLHEDIYVLGGAVMCDLGARESTLDIDAYYNNVFLIEGIGKKISEKLGKEYNVINDEIRPFLSLNGTYRLHKSLSNLKIYYATSEYLFALKCSSCRIDSNDVRDLDFLVKELGIISQKQASSIIEEFFRLESVDSLYKDVLEDIWSGTTSYYYLT